MTGKGKRKNSSFHKANVIRAYEYNIFLNSILHGMQLYSYAKDMYPDFYLKGSVFVCTNDHTFILLKMERYLVVCIYEQL